MKQKSIDAFSGDFGDAELVLQAPIKGGSYWIETSVSDDSQIIGTSREHINVNPGDITDLQLPRCVPGSTSEISITFHNSSDIQVEAAFSLNIYDGSTQKAEFVPVVYTIPSNTDQTTVFSWKIPSDFPGGNYLAVATVTVGDYVTSMSKNFGIGGLDSGWNLISLPLEPVDSSIDNVLAPLSGLYQSVWSYNNGSWILYTPDNPGFSDLTEMTSGKGYWIKMNGAANFSVSGTTPPISINLNSGWNLVGFNLLTSETINDALSSIDGKYISIWAFVDGQWKVYDPNNPELSDLTSMEPNWGYWINALQSCTWTLP
jgi:hypothetical protein